MAEFVLVPGMWLDGASWDAVVAELERAGHRAQALTLPGLESRGADRSGVTLRDHVEAVVSAVDAADGEVVLVGHSAGAGIAYAAADAQVDRVARLVLVGGFPTADGGVLVGGYEEVDGEIPLPDWSQFDDADLGGLDEAALAQFRERAIPSPGFLGRDPQRLSDERRYRIPVTVVATEFSSADLRDWIAGGAPPVQEFTRFDRVDYVDLPTGHWPQLTRPVDLAQVLLALVVEPAEG